MSFRISQPSHQSLYIEIQALGQKIATGTAFIAWIAGGQPFLLTNRHIVTGRHQETGELLCKDTAAIPDALVVWHNKKGVLGEFLPATIPLYIGDSPRWIEHPALGAKADFVALAPQADQSMALFPYLADPFVHNHIEPSQTVSVVGFPFGKRNAASFAVWATGFIATEPEINHDGLPVFLIDCRSRKGQSGSPVIQYRTSGGFAVHDGSDNVDASSGTLLGIYSGRINEHSDLGIVWKTYAIAELLVYATATLASSRQPEES